MLILPQITFGSPLLSGHVFNGSDNYLSMSTGNFGSITTTRFAFCCDFRVKADRADESMILSLETVAVPSGHRITLSTANTGTYRIRFVFHSDGTSYNYESGFEGEIGEVVSVLFHFDSGSMSCWVNGVADTPNSTAGSGSVRQISGQVNYGRRVDNASYFNGVVKKPAFFDNVLPTAAAIFQANGRIKNDLSGESGLKSYLDEASVVSDSVLVADWTNNNSVILGA